MTARLFNLKAALSGEPVQFDGCSETYTFDQFDKGSDGHPLRFHNHNGFFTASLDGIAYGGQTVRMAPRKVKKTTWVNLYGEWSGMPRMWRHYASEQAAKLNQHCELGFLYTFGPIEIEVEE